MDRIRSDKQIAIFVNLAMLGLFVVCVVQMFTSWTDSVISQDIGFWILVDIAAFLDQVSYFGFVVGVMSLLLSPSVWRGFLNRKFSAMYGYLALSFANSLFLAFTQGYEFAAAIFGVLSFPVVCILWLHHGRLA